jgi:AraC-like DNA-binding protein
MDQDLLKILFIILCFQLLFVSFVLFLSKKGKPLSNKLLAIVFFMLAFSVLNLYWVVFGVEVWFPPLMFIDDTFMFAYGPLLFLFTQSVLFRDYKLERKNLIHLIPFFVTVCLLAGILVFVDNSTMVDLTKQMKGQRIPFYFWAGNILLLLYTMYYLLRSKKAVQKVLGKTLDRFSAFDPVTFRLSNFILNSFIILFLIATLHAVLPFMGFSGGLAITLILMVLFTFYFINSVLFKMLKLSAGNSALTARDNVESPKKYAGSNMTAIQLAENKMRVWDHMVTTKRYLDNELTIDELARDLGLPPKIVSQVINEGFSSNFFDFVNKFRVEEAKSLLINPPDDKMTIQEIMYHAGFNTKSSFNTAFKKFTGQTPTQFKNSL